MLYRMSGLVMVVAGVAACDMPPEGTNVDDVARFQAAVASIGCEMVGESDYVPVEFQAGLTREQTQQMVGYHLATERAVQLESGGVRLTDGPCAPAEAVTLPAEEASEDAAEST